MLHHVRQVQFPVRTLVHAAVAVAVTAVSAAVAVAVVIAADQVLMAVLTVPAAQAEAPLAVVAAMADRLAVAMVVHRVVADAVADQAPTQNASISSNSLKC